MCRVGQIHVNANLSHKKNADSIALAVFEDGSCGIVAMVTAAEMIYGRTLQITISWPSYTFGTSKNPKIISEQRRHALDYAPVFVILL